MTFNPDTRASLLLRIRDPRDEQAWATFLEVYQPLIQRLARGRGLQDADANELTQEVLIAVAGAIDRWNPDKSRGTFRGWLATVTRNLLVNHLDKQRRQPRGSGDTDVAQWLHAQPAPVDETGDWFNLEYKRQIFRWAAERVRGDFQSSTWQAFWMTCVDGTPIPQAAAELGLTAGAVYVARSRVMARLRERIQEFEGE